MPSTTATRRPIEISDLFSRRARRVSIGWGDGEDETFTVGYHPDRYTMEVHARLQMMNEASEEATQFDAVAELMVSLLSEWDLTADGAPYPITKENLMALGLPLMGAISEAVQADFTLGKRTSNANGTVSSGS